MSRRLIEDWWEATPEERLDLLALLDDVRIEIERLHAPDGFNVGFNSGETAGQTISHLHIHVIPRYQGDVSEPAGGIRNVISNRAHQPAPSAQTDIGPSTPILVDGQIKFLLGELVEHLRAQHFDRIDVVVSFIKRSGLQLLMPALLDALDRGAHVRFLTTDYLELTEREALARMHDLLLDYESTFEVRLFHDPNVSFHPKAYIFYSRSGGPGAAFVGSSNLSHAGLNGGIEWNLLIGATQELQERFLSLWSDPRTVPLTEEFLRNYNPALTERPAAVEIAEDPIELPIPRPIQEEALAALAETRSQGFKAGLVTMATGLGKTWLAAFDTVRPEVNRVLFVAHREEILRQSRDVFRQVSPDSSLGLYFGEEKQPDADFVFATVQTLSRHLDLFAPDSFSYIIVDEFHHAAADSYRKILDYFTPDFLLGLTATPERTDGADLLALCADNLVYECDLVEGIRRNELVPFQYWGVRDTVDFEPIPWRNGRFDPAALEAAIETQERAEAAFREWGSRRGARTLAFCASTHHADFMTRFFRDRGVHCASVHSGTTSAPRRESLDDLRKGDLEVIFSVDIFNEGLDVPSIDTVLMLRPTESPVIFLQQLGRGLRTDDTKEHLTVIDFIGNHRSFLLKPRTLLGLGSGTVPTTLQVLTAMEKGDFELPAGCSVDYDLNVIEMLRALSRTSGSDALEEYCKSYVEEEGLRPTAAQAFRAGHDPAAASGKYASWFSFLAAINLLGARESAVAENYGDVLAAIQAEPITRCYKLVALRALIHDKALRTGDEIARNAETSRRILLTDPRLRRDIPTGEFPNLNEAPKKKWSAYWRRWPLAHLSGEGKSERSDSLFRLETDRLVPTFQIDDSLGDVFDSMAAEIIEYRITRYVVNQTDVTMRSWTCRLALTDGYPVIRLDRRQSPDLPEGRVRVSIDGEEYDAVFGKGAMNQAFSRGSKENALPDLLRRWFGTAAGQPGSSNQVKVERTDAGLTIFPCASESAIEYDFVPFFGDYTVACQPPNPALNAGEFGIRHNGDRPLRPTEHFVCFARDELSDADGVQIRRGDPLLFERITQGSVTDYIGQAVLAKLEGPAGDVGQLIVLPPNPQHARPAARLISQLSQRELNPLSQHLGEAFKRVDIPPLYGFEFNRGNWASGHVSLPGHAILFVTLEKREDATPYVDHFEGPDVFVWSSQLSTSPDGKKGKEILKALETGISIELWVRRRSQDVAFIYVGRVVPLRHKGSQPMSVTFRLLTPLTGEIQSALGVQATR